ncbi:MAG: hypothetical protein O2894_02005 [Planctomycetota bacterium]|nr:hypothetical protein [Planctomycetota bacterium]
MTHWKSCLTAVLAVAIGLMLIGCCGSPWGCEAPDPCTPSCSPCDPCAGGNSARPQGLPDAAQAGEAWCRVLIPAQYEDYEEKVCCKPAGTNREWIAPVYEDRETKVCCKPAACKQICIPAEYKDETDKVCTCPARTVWKKIPCEPDGLADGEKQGDCWKLEEIPAQYKEVTRRVCTKPASTRTETIAPEFKTVTEKVMVKPGEWKCSPTPAEYKTNTKRRMVAPCRWEWRRNEACDVPDAAPADADADADGDAPDAAPADADADADGDAKADAVDTIADVLDMEPVALDEAAADELGDAPAGK